jgi:hypothetical protein
MIAGAVGYYGARLQSQVSIRQVDAEGERLHVEHAEIERQRRLDSYHNFLTLLYRLDAMMAGFAPLSKETFDSWLDDFQSLYGGIDLYGTGSVRECMSEVKNALDEVGMDAQHLRGNGTFEKKFADAYSRGRKRLIQTVELAIEAMRQDIALR